MKKEKIPIKKSTVNGHIHRTHFWKLCCPKCLSSVPWMGPLTVYGIQQKIKNRRRPGQCLLVEEELLLLIAGCVLVAEEAVEAVAPNAAPVVSAQETVVVVAEMRLE